MGNPPGQIKIVRFDGIAYGLSVFLVIVGKIIKQFSVKGAVATDPFQSCLNINTVKP